MAKVVKLEINNGEEVLLTTTFGLGENELTRGREVNKEIEKLFMDDTISKEQFETIDEAFGKYREFTKALISLIRHETKKIEKIESILEKED